MDPDQLASAEVEFISRFILFSKEFIYGISTVKWLS